MGQLQGRQRAEELRSLDKPLMELVGIEAGSRLRTVAPPLASAVGRVGRVLLGKDLHAHYPRQLERLEGIADGAGIGVHKLFVGPSIEIALNRSVYTMPPAGACTAAAVSGQRSETGAAMIVKNFDYPRAGLETYLVRRSRPRSGFASLDVTNSPLCGSHEGINERGLAIAYNYGHFRGRSTARVSITTLVQETLEVCAGVAEAIEHLRERPRIGGALLMLADAKGHLASVEIAPDLLAVRRGDCLTHANHALTREMESRDVPRNAIYPRWWRPREARGLRVLESSERRHERAAELLGDGVASEEHMFAVASDHDGRDRGDDYTICRHGPYYATTCSLLMIPERRAMKLRFGAPCEGEYTELTL